MSRDLYLTGDALAPYLRGERPLGGLAERARDAFDADGKVVVIEDHADGSATVMRVVRTERQLGEWLETLAAVVDPGATPAPLGLRLFEAPRAVGRVGGLTVSTRTVEASDGPHTVTHVLFRTPGRVRPDGTYHVVSPDGAMVQIAVERARRDGDETVVEGVKLG